MLFKRNVTPKKSGSRPIRSVLSIRETTSKEPSLFSPIDYEDE